MTGLVPSTPADEETDITNTPFFPAISPADCRLVIRLEQNITAERLRAALVNAIMHINTTLDSWKNEQIAGGFSTLDDIEAEEIDGTSINLQHYKRAVYFHAKAELIDQYLDADVTASGVQRAEEKGETADDYRRGSILAIRSILGRPQSTVELI
jgi:hypothetical protein